MRHRITWKLANCLGRLWYALDRRHRMIALRNLDLAFGDELNQETKQAICLNTFIHLSCVFLELPSLFRLNENNLDQYITFSGTEHLFSVLEKGKGILVMASHFGNWELMSLAFSMRYTPFHVVMRPLDNALLNDWVVRMRTRGGNETISKGESARRIIRLLRRGEAVALLVDQNVDWYEGVFVPFFKEIACTSKALATLALRTDSLVLSVYNYREPDGRYHMVIQPEVEITRSKDSAADVEQNTALFNRVIEGYVREHPEQWFWLHQRWKTRPSQPIPEPPPA
jgi:Kdo2-lipid IVA lauroyltransferase/acyltransferase